MKIPRVLVAEFVHETNTFCKEKTGKEQYKNGYIKFGEEIIKFFKGTKAEIGAFIDCSKAENFDIIPTIAANSMPGGPVTRDMFELVKTNIINESTLKSQLQGELFLILRWKSCIIK